jgi:hypothetical protein
LQSTQTHLQGQGTLAQLHPHRATAIELALLLAIPADTHEVPHHQLVLLFFFFYLNFLGSQPFFSIQHLSFKQEVEEKKRLKPLKRKQYMNANNTK